MSDEVIEQRTRQLTLDDSLVVRRHPDGHRICLCGSNVICTDSISDVGVLGKLLIRCRNQAKNTGTVASIGGGFCCGPRLWGPRYTSTVYEIESAVSRYCPQYATFVAGDYKATITGTFDIIVYDINDPPDMALIESHLAVDGLFLTTASVEG